MLKDQFGRHINYLRLSLTDRCNYRCTYCMPEDMTFAPRRDNLASDELVLICRAFVELGVKKIRLTGGEPMIHPDFPQLLSRLSAFEQLERIAVTTNGSLLQQYLPQIKHSKVSQLNISLDSIDPAAFSAITRTKTGEFERVVAGIEAAVKAGIERIRLNAVVSKGFNDHELVDLVRFALDKGVHIAFIEEMPMGHMPDYHRSEHYLSNEDVRLQLEQHFELEAQTNQRQQAGPARYFTVAGTHSEVGFISPHSDNFCAACNRVRVTREGQLVLCLGNEDSLDLRTIVREQASENDALVALKAAIVQALGRKPESHKFDIANDDWQVVRFMNVTGG